MTSLGARSPRRDEGRSLNLPGARARGGRRYAEHMSNAGRRDDRLDFAAGHLGALAACRRPIGFGDQPRVRRTV